MLSNKRVEEEETVLWIVPLHAERFGSHNLHSD